MQRGSAPFLEYDEQHITSIRSLQAPATSAPRDHFSCTPIWYGKAIDFLTV
jgi:hypothetical protein